MSEPVSPAARVARGATYIYLHILLAHILGVVHFAFATRFLTVYEVGVLSLLALITTIFPTFFSLSLPAALTKFVPEFIGSGKADLARGVIKKGIATGLAVSLFFPSLSFLASSVISSLLFGSPIYQYLLELLALDIFVLMLSPFLGEALIGLQKFREISIANSLGYGVKYAVAIVLLHCNFGLLGVVLGWIVGDFSRMVLYIHFLLPFRDGSASVPFSRLIKYSAPIYLAGCLNYLSARVDQFLMILYLGLKDLGIYNAAITASWVVSSISDSISSALFPQFAERFGRKDSDALSNASYGASRYLSIIYLPLAIGLATVALPTITLFAGPKYIEGSTPLVLFSLTSAIGCLGLIANSVIASLGRTKIFLWMSLLSFSVDAILCLIFMPWLGIVGASLGRMISSIVAFGFIMYNLKKIFGWHFDRVALKKSWLNSAIMGLTVLIVQQFLVGKFYLPLYILIGGVSYFVLMRLFRVMNASDVALVKDFLPKRLEFVADILAKLLVV